MLGDKNLDRMYPEIVDSYFETPKRGLDMKQEDERKKKEWEWTKFQNRSEISQSDLRNYLDR